MWPFAKKPEPPDNRPPSLSAKAVALSLESEPARWKASTDGRWLVHDSLITVDATESWIRIPDFYDEPEADNEVIWNAVQKWIANRLALPASPAQPAAEGE